MEKVEDRGLGSIFNARDLLAGQGVSKRRTAQSAKVAADLAGLLGKEGTSEGARLGWEGRRGHAGYGAVSVPPSQGEQARRLRGAPAKFVGQPKPEEEPKGGKTYPVVYRPGGKGTFGEVRRVTVPPREDEPEKMRGSFLTEGEVDKKEFMESEHPRGSEGKFAPKGGAVPEGFEGFDDVPSGPAKPNEDSVLLRAQRGDIYEVGGKKWIVVRGGGTHHVDAYALGSKYRKMYEIMVAGKGDGTADVWQIGGSGQHLGEGPVATGKVRGAGRGEVHPGESK